MADVIALIARFLGSGLFDRLADAMAARQNAQTEQERIAAEIEIARIRSVQGRGRLFDLLVFLAGLPLVLHLGCVALVSAVPGWFPGWTVHALPAPMDDWQGQIILSLFGLAGLARVLRR